MLLRLFFFYCHGAHRDLHALTHSFPTRRSSDLRAAPAPARCCARRHAPASRRPRRISRTPGRCRGRSEEHTSELQSLMRLSYAVFCLKKRKYTSNKQTKDVNNKMSNTNTILRNTKQIKKKNRKNTNIIHK